MSSVQSSLELEGGAELQEVEDDFTARWGVAKRACRAVMKGGPRRARHGGGGLSVGQGGEGYNSQVYHGYSLD